MPLRRATLAEVQREGVLDSETKALRLGRDEVSLAYFRAGYTPHDYPGEAEWEARLLIERSFALKCPSIGQHLAGTKKVQQVLAAPAMLALSSNGGASSGCVPVAFHGSPYELRRRQVSWRRPKLPLAAAAAWQSSPT